MFYGWRLAIILGSIYFLSTGTTIWFFSIIMGSMASDLGWSMTATAFGYSLFTMMMGLGAPLVAFCLRRFGARLTIFTGAVLMALGAFITSFANSLTHYYLGAGVLLGLGFCLATVLPIQTTLTHWFKVYRGKAFSFTLTAGGISGFVAAPLISWMVINVGWRGGWIFTAVVTSLVAAIALWGVRNTPESVGLLPDGISHEIIEKNQIDKVYRTSREWTVWEAIRTKSLLYIIVASAAFGMPVGVVLSQSVFHLRNIGYSPSVAAGALGMVALFSTIGRFSSGFLNDNFQSRYILLIGLSLQTAGIFILTLATSLPLVYLFAIFFGLGYGTCYITIAVITGNYFGRECFAAINGLVSPVLVLLGAASTVLAGAIFDRSGTYMPIFYLLLIVLAFGIVAAFLAKPPQCETQLTGNLSRPV